MNKPFRSRDFNFRPTTMAAALWRAGINRPAQLVREPKTLGVPAGGRPFVVPS